VHFCSSGKKSCSLCAAMTLTKACDQPCQHWGAAEASRSELSVVAFVLLQSQSRNAAYRSLCHQDQHVSQVQGVNNEMQ
jgi:hypothetical protein